MWSTTYLSGRLRMLVIMHDTCGFYSAIEHYHKRGKALQTRIRFKVFKMARRFKKTICGDAIYDVPLGHLRNANWYSPSY